MVSVEDHISTHDAAIICTGVNECCFLWSCRAPSQVNNPIPRTIERGSARLVGEPDIAGSIVTTI